MYATNRAGIVFLHTMHKDSLCNEFDFRFFRDFNQNQLTVDFLVALLSYLVIFHSLPYDY